MEDTSGCIRDVFYFTVARIIFPKSGKRYLKKQNATHAAVISEGIEQYSLYQKPERSTGQKSMITKLSTIKIIHTAIWLFMNIVIFYLLYAVIINKIDKWIGICIGIFVLETLTLLFFKMVCPLTIIARKYSNSTKDNFDIYLPNWLAKYNKQIYVTIFVAIMAILVYRLVSK